MQTPTAIADHLRRLGCTDQQVETHITHLKIYRRKRSRPRAIAKREPTSIAKPSKPRPRKTERSPSASPHQRGA
jgi:hypothetical protein